MYTIIKFMKICMLAKQCDPMAGGVGRHIYELSRRLVEEGHDVTVVLREGQKVPDIDAEFVEVSYRNLGPEVLDNYSSAWSVYRFLKRRGEEFDVVHGHEVYGALGYRLSEEKGYSYVYTVHGLAYNLISREFLKPLAKILHYPERLAVNNADRVVAVSENTRREVLEDYSVEESKVETIYNGVDTEKFSSSQDFENKILYVGEFLERKGADIVIDSFNEISDVFPEVKLVLVGKGRIEEELREKVSDSGLEDRVDFRKNVSDEELRDLYSSSVFVMPSKYEGQGIVYVEAMSCGAPVIGCDNSAIPEMIEDGVNGYLIDRTSEALSDALESILEDDDLRESMGRSSREKAKDFDWNNIAKKTLRLYNNL